MNSETRDLDDDLHLTKWAQKVESTVITVRGARSLFNYLVPMYEDKQLGKEGENRRAKAELYRREQHRSRR